MTAAQEARQTVEAHLSAERVVRAEAEEARLAEEREARLAAEARLAEMEAELRRLREQE